VRKLIGATTLGVVTVLTGCATMQSHDQKIAGVQAASENGSIESAISQLDAGASTDAAKKELLYNLERGELLRLAKQYQESTKSYMQADEIVKVWEETAKTNPDKLLGTLGASLISERLKTYEGQDYEKVMLTTRLALNRIAAGDWDNARVDVKRTHEREAVISELRAKEVALAEEEAKSKGVQPSGKELNGYPVETINDPAVLELKNGYQNALSHYLSGFLYEVLNEPGLAAPGYRKANELKPNSPVLEEGLRGLDQRTSFTHRRKQRMTDVLFIVESGSAPARKPTSFTLPVPTGRGVVTASISYPVITPSNTPFITSISVGGSMLKPEPVVDFNVMARRALKDEMPGMMLRGAVRAVAKGVVQDQAQQKLGLLGGLASAAFSVVSEQADDRMWRMLPERVYVARGYLPPGEHKLVIDQRETATPVKIDGQYAVVPLRVYSNSLLVGDVASFGSLAATQAMPAADTKAATDASAKPAAKPATKPAARKAKPAASAAAPVAKPAVAAKPPAKPASGAK
jgi:hypothetical protein